MKISVKECTNKEVLVLLSGDMDSAAAQDFALQMAPLISNPVNAITLDFSELQYISSAGMRTLLLLNKGAAQKGGKLSIIGMCNNIRQIFQLTGFDQMIDIL